MLIPLGILASAGGAATSYDLLETQTLSSAVTSVTFNVSSYAADYQHLQVRWVVRSDRAATGDSMLVYLNGDSGANYVTHTLLVLDSSAAGSYYDSGMTTAMDWTPTTAANNTANVFAAGIMDFVDAFETNKFTTRQALTGYVSSNGNGIFHTTNLWRNTNAISSITFDQRYGSNFVQNSRFSLYGLKGA